MKFKNTGEQALTFTLDKAYTVEPGKTVDISDNVAFAVKSMGLALEGEDDKDKPPVDPSPRISNKQPTAADKSSVQEPAFHVDPPAPNAPIPGAPPAVGSGIPTRDAGGTSQGTAAQHTRQGSVRPKP